MTTGCVLVLLMPQNYKTGCEPQVQTCLMSPGPFEFVTVNGGMLNGGVFHLLASEWTQSKGGKGCVTELK